MKFNTKKLKKRALWLTIIAIIFINIIAYNHAYRFTHFIEIEEGKTAERIKPEDLSLVEKVKILLLGIPNHKPKNAILPSANYKTIKIQSNETLDTWLIPSTTAAKGIVILFHGYTGEKSSLLAYSQAFNKMGYPCLLVDFMGSGSSTGVQTTIGFKESENVKAVYDHVKNEFPNQKIILFGHSMGAVAIMKAVSDYDLKPEKIIVQCPFGTMKQTVKKRFEAMNVPSFPFAHLLLFYGGIQNGFNAFHHNPTDYAKNITVPTLLTYGEKDGRVTRPEIDEIYKNLNGQKQLVTFKNSGHEDYLVNSNTEWLNKITNFVNK
jgi:alpha-beta hydrolase superfamily lysophospholipase